MSSMSDTCFHILISLNIYANDKGNDNHDYIPLTADDDDDMMCVC